MAKAAKSRPAALAGRDQGLADAVGCGPQKDRFDSPEDADFAKKVYDEKSLKSSLKLKIRGGAP